MLCRNAERSNTFKLDLHALHVDEALDEVAKTISDLSKMKCKFICYDVAFCDRQITSLPARWLTLVQLVMFVQFSAK